jgi:ferric-dicitrate binding protein FerR (iron transport regulator)
MSDWIDQFIFYDELGDEARSTLRSSLKKHGDVVVEAAFDEWIHLRKGLGETFGSLVKDRRQLVNFAMWRHGNARFLTSAELTEVQENLALFEEAMRGSVAFRAIVERIGEDQSDFVDTWRLHVSEPTEMPTTPSLAEIRRQRASRRMSELVWRSAAVFVIAASTIALYMGLGIDSSTVVVKGEPGLVRSVALDDGTTVRLVNGAELQYQRPEQGESFNRKVSLLGRALFRVTPGQDQFVVETPAAITTVWGTTFGLDSDETFTEVVLAEGRVSVVSRRDSQHPVVLEPGEMTRVVGVRPPTAPVRVNITDALSYTRLFVFRNEKTLMIADKLSEQYGIPITVHPELAQETVTGTFERDWSLSYIIQAVARALDCRATGSEAEGFELIPLESGQP